MGLCREIRGTTNRTLKRQVRKETTLKYFQEIADPTLLYKNKIDIEKDENVSKIQEIGMKCLRSLNKGMHQITEN
jgi:hypothetical protein